MHIDSQNSNSEPEQSLSNNQLSIGEVNLRELLEAVWEGKHWILGTTLLAAILSVLIALWLPNIYRSEALIAVYDEENGLASLASQYGGLATLAGISIPSGGTNDKQIGIEVLLSRRFISDFMERRDILPELFAAKSFDWANEQLHFDDKIYEADSQTWVRRASPPFQSEPSSQEAYLEFVKVLSVSEDTDTGFVEIAVQHLSPIVAEQWVRWLVEDINNTMMERAVVEAQQSIDYLSAQLENTQVVALQEVFYSLIEDQTKTIMLANARPEYLFETIDPAIVPELKAGPKRALICILSVLFGGTLGMALVLIRHYSVRESN